MLEIQELDPLAARGCLDSLTHLLQDAVEHGASVGFLPPLQDSEARNFWLSTIDAMETGGRLLLIARNGDQIVGSVQLALAGMPNGRHRAEVMKLFVHTNTRRQGIGERLMQALEQRAREHGRTLLVLDTREGDPSEFLYQKVGYTKAGVIPQYARSASGDLHTTAFYYKALP